MFKFYFSFIFLMMVSSIEQNTFIVVSYFRNGRFINGEWRYSLSDCKNEFWAKYPDNIRDHSLLTHIGRIVNRFLKQLEQLARVNHHDGHQYLIKL
jgi:hypothetical protein